MPKKSAPKIFVFILSALTSLISMLTTFFIAKPLGSELYGKIQFYIGVIQITTVICSFGMQYFITRRVQHEKNAKGFVFSCILLVLFWSISIFPIFYKICSDVLAGFESSALIVLVFISSVAMAVLTCVGAFFLGTFNSSKSVLFENFLPKFSLFAFAVFLLYNIYSISIFPDLYLFAHTCIYASISLFFVVRFATKANIKLLLKDFGQILSFFILTLTFSLNNALSKVIGVEVYNSFSGVGALSLCVQIISVAKVFTGVVTTISRPVFSKIQNDIPSLLDYFRKVIRINSFIVIPFCFGFIAQSKFILSIFGDDYASFYYLLIIFSFETLVSELTGPNGTMLAMSGHEKVELFNGIANIIAFVVFSLAFSSFGIVGLALSSLTAVVVTNIMKLIELFVIYKTNPYSLKLVFHLLILCAVSFAVFTSLSFINNGTILLILDIVAGLILIILFNLFSTDRTDKFFFIQKG